MRLYLLFSSINTSISVFRWISQMTLIVDSIFSKLFSYVNSPKTLRKSVALCGFDLSSLLAFHFIFYWSPVSNLRNCFSSMVKLSDKQEYSLDCFNPQVDLPNGACLSDGKQITIHSHWDFVIIFIYRDINWNVNSFVMKRNKTNWWGTPKSQHDQQ